MPDEFNNKPVPLPESAKALLNIFVSEKLRRFGPTELQEKWQASRQSVLALEIRKANAEFMLPAVILDTRGWIATSFSAIAGADTIRARMAPAGPGFAASTRDVSVEVTQVVAMLPEYDLILLEVDRKMVELIRNTPVLERTPVTASWLLGIGPVAKGWKIWALETQIVRSPPIAAVNDPTSEQRFLIVDRPNEFPAPGTPLFDSNGNLAGITCAGLSEGNQLAAPAEAIQAWLKQIETKPKLPAASISIQNIDVSSALFQFQPPTGRIPTPEKQVIETKPVEPDSANSNPDELSEHLADVPDVLQPVDTGESIGELQKRIQNLAKSCSEFGFVPKTPEQIQPVRELARVLDAARIRLEIPEREPGSLSRNDWRDLDRVSQNALDNIIAQISATPRVHLEKSNLLIRNENPPADSGPDIVFCITLLNAATSPTINSKPTTIFEIEGDANTLICAIDPEKHVFRFDTRWMLVGKWSNESSMSINTTANGKIIARVFELAMPVGPFR